MGAAEEKVKEPGHSASISRAVVAHYPNGAPTAHPSLEHPTRVRYWVIVFAVTLAMVTYIDRVCISIAAPAISENYS